MKPLHRDNSETPREIHLVTIGTFRRARVLCSEDLHRRLVETFRESADQMGWLVGKYLVMPERISFFCAPKSPGGNLSRFVTHWKNLTTRKSWELGHTGALWQGDFFDHPLGEGETCEGKWEELRAEPVRACLCASADEWRYQGGLDWL